MIYGEYRAPLRSGGKLVVSAYNWKIEYYFSGVDLRHNGTFFEIEDKEIDKYVSARKNNFKTYTALQTKFSYNESFETTGEKNMPIRIGKFSGVYLMPFNLPVKNENELNRLLSDYAYAKKRATHVQCMMKTL